MKIDRDEITGMVLAGGRGTRMGGVDKGLQTFHGMPLALHAMLRLAPQVGEVMINANRNLAAYESMGVPVWPDVVADFPGPLGGWLTGLERCTTPWLVTVPCDTPNFPNHLVERLARELAAAEGDIAMVATRADGETNLQPIFSLIRASLVEDLTRAVQAGERKVARWARQHRLVEVVFEETGAFYNANTVEELRRLEAGQKPLG